MSLHKIIYWINKHIAPEDGVFIKKFGNGFQLCGGPGIDFHYSDPSTYGGWTSAGLTILMFYWRGKFFGGHSSVSGFYGPRLPSLSIFKDE